MARNWYGSQRVTREDMYTSKLKYTDSDIRGEKLKMVIWIVLGALYMYYFIQPQNW